jgi:hypothetical protein
MERESVCLCLRMTWMCVWMWESRVAYVFKFGKKGVRGVRQKRGRVCGCLSGLVRQIRIKEKKQTIRRRRGLYFVLLLLHKQTHVCLCRKLHKLNSRWKRFIYFFDFYSAGSLNTRIHTYPNLQNSSNLQFKSLLKKVMKEILKRSLFALEVVEQKVTKEKANKRNYEVSFCCNKNFFKECTTRSKEVSAHLIQ